MNSPEATETERVVSEADVGGSRTEAIDSATGTKDPEDASTVARKVTLPETAPNVYIQ